MALFNHSCCHRNAYGKSAFGLEHGPWYFDIIENLLSAMRKACKNDDELHFHTQYVSVDMTSARPHNNSFMLSPHFAGNHTGKKGGVAAECNNGVLDMRRCPWLALALALGHPQGSQLGDKDEGISDQIRSGDKTEHLRKQAQLFDLGWLFRMTSGECVFSEGDSSGYGHELWQTQTIPFYWVRSFFLNDMRYITATRLPSFIAIAKGQSC